MIKATISQVKNSLSAYLKKVRAGETVVILDRREPVAVLERIHSTANSDDRLSRLEQAGLLRRSRSARPLKALEGPSPRARASVLAALLDERREGR